MLQSFLKPLYFRWRSRNVCPCECVATMRCSKHGSKLCSDRLCVGLHRWAFSDETCTIESLRGPLDYAIYALGVLVAVLFVVMVWVRI